MASKLKAVLFDMDGTLIDTETQYAVFWNRIGGEMKPPVQGLHARIKGTTMRQILDRYFPTPEAREWVLPQLMEFEQRMDYPFFPGARELVEDLRCKGVKCAIVTSSDQKKMANVYRVIPELPRLFDRILTAEDFSASKPSPDCYLRGAEALDANLDECIVFEDALTGLQAGMASGILTIGVATGMTMEELRPQCHHAVTSLQSLSTEVLEEWLCSYNQTRKTGFQKH